MDGVEEKHYSEHLTFFMTLISLITYCMNMTLIQVLEQDLAALRPPVTSRVETDQDLTLDVEAFIQSFNVLQGMLLDM